MFLLPDLSSLSIGWRDLVDIALVTLLIYQLILLVRGTRSLTVLMGLLGIMVLHFFSGVLGISTLNWLLDGFLNYLFLVVIIVFQRDIRSALSRLGSRQRLFFSKRHLGDSPEMEEICKAAQYLAQKRIGALIVIERGTPLGDVTEKSVSIDAEISSDLLCTIFWPGSPLHDGAVVVKDSRIVAAGCILPLASGIQGRQDYGTRHRAALGISEESDAVTLVVSEEKGFVRLASGGQLSAPLEGSALKDNLSALLDKRRAE